jgi:hypothetical protein
MHGDQDSERSSEGFPNEMDVRQSGMNRFKRGMNQGLRVWTRAAFSVNFIKPAKLQRMENVFPESE